MVTINLRQSTLSASGMDGWRVAELKALPDFLLDKLAILLNVVEMTGTWPHTLERALVSLIPKGEGGEPLAMRPISVTSAVYRLWAATRLRDAVMWQESWAQTGQHGFRMGRGILLDYSKCFDRLPHNIMLKLAEKTGAHARLMAPLRRIYAAIRRRFKVAGGVGKEFKATNGILQGCPLSVVLLNLMVAVWARAVSEETMGQPEPRPQTTSWGTCARTSG